MKIVCKLEKIVDTITSKGIHMSFAFIPVKDAYRKCVKLVISRDNAVDVMSNLDLPVTQGDTVEVEFSPKQTQSKLKEDEEDGVQDKGTSRKTRRTAG